MKNLAVLKCLSFVLTLSLSHPVFAQPIEYREGPNGGQIIDIDFEPSGTAQQTGVGYNPSHVQATGAAPRIGGTPQTSISPEPHKFPTGMMDPEPGSALHAIMEENRLAEEAARRERLLRERRGARDAAEAAGRPGRKTPPTAEELDELMKKLLDDNIKEVDKKRIASYVFYHSDVYRKGVMLEKAAADSPQLKVYLEKYKPELHQEIISRMGVNYKNKYGHAPKTPIIPFGFNNAFSDDDVVTGSGEIGRRLEAIFNEELSNVLQERMGRPMTEADRLRIDVNGLAWNMTEEAAHLDFDHKEKYINPKSGNANKKKLKAGAASGAVVVYEYDHNGRAIKLSPEDAAKAIDRLEVGEPIRIPGIDPEIGSASMSDFLRMADKHKIKPNGKVTIEEIISFNRNQKYSPRGIEEYEEVLKANPELSKEYSGFIELSGKLRKAQTVRETAELLQAHYGVKLITEAGEIDYDAMTKVMLEHQDTQINKMLPKMISAVTQSEAYKIVAWLKKAGKGDRALLRKQMALTYATMDDAAIEKIIKDLDAMDISADDKAFLKGIVQNDSRQIRRYAVVLKMDPQDFVPRLRAQGDNFDIVAYISKSAKVRPVVQAMDGFNGGKVFREFLETKTAKALNLDMMLSPDASKGEKFMSWTMMLSIAAVHFSQGKDTKASIKNVALAMFETIPFVASALRFSEGEGREAFKEFAMDVLPPVAIINIGVQVFKYTANTGYSLWTDSKMDQLAQSVLDDMSDDDFEKSEVSGMYRLKNRAELMEFLDEVAPGLGRIAKFPSLVAPEIDARMSRNRDVQNNEAALVTCMWFDGFNFEKDRPTKMNLTDFAVEKFFKSVNGVITNYSIEDLKRRVYDDGVPALGSAPANERVAAKFILDNIRIRKEMYYEVLNEFANRIEKLYNDKKGEEEGYGAIIGKTMAIIKEMYENAPAKIKESEFGRDQLDGEYRTILEYLTNYKNEKGLTDLEIDREMQDLIEKFAEYIRKLAISVDIKEEMRYLDLKVHLYGGEEGFEPTEELLLGGAFRVGISARVSPIRKDQKWTVYYYGLNHETGNIGLIGQKSINGKKFNPGNKDGRWIIETPEKETIIEISGELLKTYFPSERPYFIRPVLAFGNWDADPLTKVGAEALKNPIDFSEMFKDDQAASLGEAVEFGVFRGVISLETPQWVYKDDQAKVKAVLRIPNYAHEQSHTIEFEAYSGGASQLSISPESHSPAAADNFNPPKSYSESDLSFPKNAEEATYELTASAKLKGIADEFQPYSATRFINYVNSNNPEGDNADDEQGGDDDGESTASQLQGLLEQITALHQEAEAKLQEVKARADAFRDQVKAYEQQVADMEAKINQQVPTKYVPFGEKPQDIFNEMKSVSEKLAALRDQVEALTLAVCESYERINTTTQVADADSIQSATKSKYAELQRVYNDAKYYMDRMNTLKSKIRTEADAQKEADLADQLASEAQVLVAEGESIVDRGRVLQGEIVGMETFTGRAAAIMADAQRIYDQAAAKKSDMSKEEKKQLKADKRVYKSIASFNKKVAKVAASNKKLINNHGMEVMNMGFKSEGLRNTIKLLRQRAGADKLVRDAAMNAEILAMYDAGMLYADPINEAYANSKICLNGVNSRHGQIATPEARVAQTDCSKYPGTSARWDAAAKVAKCYCPDGLQWLKKQNKCVNKRDFALANANCTAYRNTHAIYNEYKQRAECDCLAGLVWNSTKTGCEQSRQDQVAAANCSHLGPQGLAFWSTRDNKPMCTCKMGYYISNNYCVKEQPRYDPPPTYDSGGYGSTNSGGYGGNQGGGGFDAGGFLDAVTDIIEAVDGGGSGGGSGGYGTGSNSGGGYNSGASNSNCAYNYTLTHSGGLYSTNMVYKCNCSGWSYNKSSKKCVQGGGNTGITTNRSRGGYSGGNNQDTGLSDVTVNTYSPTITVWDHGTEDFDTISISVNGVTQISSLRLTKAKQTLRLNLRRGINTLKITAINEGDPAIVRRLGLPPGNAAAISITNVIKGKSQQQWILYQGQSGTIQIEY